MVNYRQKLSLLDILMIIGFASYYILPSVSDRIGILQIIFISIAYVLFTNRFKISKEQMLYLYVFIFIGLLYTIFVNASDISSTASNLGIKKFYSKFYQLFMMFFPIYLLKITCKKGTDRQKLFLILIVFAMILYVEATTRNALAINANVTRSWGNYSEELRKLNIGHYGFVYSIPIVITLLSGIFIKTKMSLKKIVLFLLIIIQFSFLLVAQYTLAVFAAILGMLLLIIVHFRKSRKIVIITFIIICILPFIPFFIKLAALHVPSESMAIRLNEVYSLFTVGDGSGYNLNGRFTLYWKSIEAFLSSPIWGNSSLDFYGHATFLVMPAMLGLLGAVPFYYIYYHSYQRVKHEIGDNWQYYFPIFVVLIFIGFTNPIEAALPLMFITWFFGPLVISQLYGTFSW